MCEQCLVNPLYYGKPIDGWTLIRARRKSDWMNVGDYGLLTCNDPSFVWGGTFDGKYASNEFLDGIVSDPDTCYSLIESCIISGYNKKKDGSVVHWLYDKIKEHLAITEPTYVEDPFPNLDDTQEHDYTLK